MEEKMMTRTSSFSTFIFIVLLLFSATSVLLAQGMIAGRVVDANSGDYLPGANVFLEGTTMGAATDREGFFMISNVPDGSYNLLVNYIGYEDYQTEVTVSSSEPRVTLDEIGLTLSAMETDVIVVEGQLEGQLKALNQQRVAPNIKNVVSRAQMEQFPDYTTADAVRRLPGVYISRDQGEGRYVLVRGTEPRLSNVKVNGEELATSRQEERYTQLDIIGSNQMASIEVVKALTPDMDGDAIGGTVNLVTRSAFDYSGMRLRATAGGGYANLRGTPLYQGKLSFSNRFGDDKNFGLTFTANWDHTDKGQHNTEKEYDDVDVVGGGELAWGLSEADLRDYYNVRDRIGIGATFEYRINPQHRLFLGGMYNKFDDNEQRGRSRFRFSRGEFSPDGTSVTGARNVIESFDRLETAIQTQFSGGGVHQFNPLQLDWKVAYSGASEEADPHLESEWEVRGIDYTIDFSDPKFPDWQQTNADEVDRMDPSVYELQGFDWRHRKATDMNLVGAVNLKFPFDISGIASELKFGGKVRMKEKDRGDTRIGYSWEGDDLTMENYATVQTAKDFLQDHYVIGPSPDEDKIKDLFNSNVNTSNLEGEEDVGDTRGQKYLAKENIYAGYAMLTMNWSDFMLLPGLRYESTTNDYEGTLLLYDDNGDFSSDSPLKDKRTYGFLMPMIHAKWQFQRMSNFRIAATRTMARPNYWDLVPFRVIDPRREEIVRGNSELEVTSAWNFDLMAEHYFVGVGVLSGGLFYKDLDNIIFVSTRTIEGGEFDRYEEELPLNGGKASLFGFELNWQQQLNFLPGMWAGFGIYANYTKTWATSDLVEDIREGEDFLPGQAGDIGNLAISYEWGPITSRVSLMYQGKYLEEVGGADDGSEDIWNDDFFTIDISAAYKIIPQLDIFAEFVNITDAPDVEYIGIANRPTLQEYTDWWMRAGLKFSL
jgi:TonB-dependent receptor